MEDGAVEENDEFDALMAEVTELIVEMMKLVEEETGVKVVVGGELEEGGRDLKYGSDRELLWSK